MAGNEMKFVHCEETVNAQAVKELADARAKCICRLQFDRCARRECESCPHDSHFMECYSSMNDYDKMRTDNRIARLYGRYSLNFESFMSYKQVKSFNMKLLLFGLFCAAMFVFLCVRGNAEGYVPKVKAVRQEVTAETDTRVREVLKAVKGSVHDLDGDGKVNCVDHAVLFKIVWDKQFKNEDCIIVRNLNPVNGMSHLFVAVFDYKLVKFVDVEPWAYDINIWQMADMWGKAYDIWYNFYGEDDKWLGKVRAR